MNKINSEIKIGVVAILSIIVLVWGLNFLKGTSVFSNNVFYYSIYSDVKGNLFDPYNGKDDLKKGFVNFIGDPDKRI